LRGLPQGKKFWREENLAVLVKIRQIKFPPNFFSVPRNSTGLQNSIEALYLSEPLFTKLF